MGLVFLTGLVACGVFAAGGPIREVISECPENYGVPICQIRGGWSIKFDAANNPVPLIYGPDGRFRFPLSFQLPGAEVSHAYDVAPDADGSFVAAAAGSAANLRGWQKSGLVMFDATGLLTAFIDTGDFHCAHVAIAPDHSIWVLGWQDTGSKERGHYAVLRKYSRTGDLPGSFLDRSTFPPGLEPGGTSSGAILFAANDRIALMAYSGSTGVNDGKVLGWMRSLLRLYFHRRLLRWPRGPGSGATTPRSRDGHKAES